jgi:hypothetical protein
MSYRLDCTVETLCEQLLRLADKEEQALTADNLGELEACMHKKEEIFKRLRSLENNSGQGVGMDKSTALLRQVSERHQLIRERVKIMRDECERALLEIRNGRRAHRAYSHSRRTGSENSARLL